MNADNASGCQGLIERLKSLLFSDDFKERHRRNKKDFTRDRCLTFTNVVTFLLNLVKRALQDELDEFFKLAMGAEIAVRIVTKSAFSQAREKLKYEAFIELNQAQVVYFYEHFEPELWHGFRLLAVDGSTSELPRTPKVTEHFGAWHPTQGAPCPLARVSQMYDPINEVTLEAIISPKAVGERALSARHFAMLTTGDLTLLDRGYPAFWLFALILEQGVQFCARMPLGGWQVVEQFVTSGRSEQVVTLWPSSESIKECRARGLSLAPIKVRLIRVELDSGETEVLATSLVDNIAYPVALFKELYHQCWPVEEDYRVMKSRAEVENYSGKSVLAVYQDFHAKVFTANLTAILAHPAQKVVAQKCRGRKYAYKVNMANALSKMKDTIVLLIQRTNVLSILKSFWQLMIRTIEPIRPGRSYPCKKRVKPKRFATSYKPLR